MEPRSALIIGAGIAGITSAVELARNGISVHLVDRQATMGGQVARFGCKATESCSKCSACVLTEKIAELRDAPSVRFHPCSRVKQIRRDGEGFRVSILQEPQPVALDRCIACGLCAQECPEQCITPTLLRAFPYGYLIDQQRCRNYSGQQCRRCAEVCPTKAISFDRSHRLFEIQVAAIVVATGFEPFNPRNKPQYGYGRFPNVVTALEVEEELSRKGRVEKPSDGQVPQDIAFIQCVGSRDPQLGNGYCSQVCCAYAVRIARLLKYRSPQTNIAIHYMDIQKFGKGFDQFYAQWKEEIRFIRGLPAEVSEVADGRLALVYEDMERGKITRGEYDLVILSVGITPSEGSRELAEVLNIKTNEFGFYSGSELDPIETDVKGIFVAGCCRGPTDIGGSIAQAKAASTKVLAFMDLNVENTQKREGNEEWN